MTLLDFIPSLQHAAPSRIDPAVWPITARVDECGRLCVGGVPLPDVADEFGTPAYVIDENDFRRRARRYRTVLRDAEIVYAGKPLLTTAVARWVREEGLGLGVCSSGELATALVGGVDPARIIMHGNVKTPGELREAAAVGVGRIVVDSSTEIALLACEVSRPQRVLLRMTSEGLDAMGVTRVMNQPLLDLVGLHCHIGSQVVDASLYGEAIRRMIGAMADIRTTHGVVLTELNIGGGHAVPYIRRDPELNLTELADSIDDALDAACAAERFPRPRVVVEPGRAISARAGVTLYRVVSVQTQAGGRTVVGVDGGMSDNPRVGLYGAKYTVTLANRHSAASTHPAAVAGRHCESGDIHLPTDLHPGDLLAVACTGAYHHSMASNYNLVGRPPVVAAADGCPREIVRRETIADLLSRDLG